MFSSLISPQSPYVIVLSSYPTLAAWDDAYDKLGKDKQFEKERDAYRASGQGFVRMEATLLRGFDTVPDIAVPPREEKRQPRIFELRTYESNNIDTLKRKVGMFNEGEIGIFRRLNMLPVFFGETIVGRNMPNLTYMLAFDDLAASPTLTRSPRRAGECLAKRSPRSNRRSPLMLPRFRRNSGKCDRQPNWPNDVWLRPRNRPKRHRGR